MKIACSKCEIVIDEDNIQDENWTRVRTDYSVFWLCKKCADGFWMAVDSGLPPVVEQGGGGKNERG